MVSKTNLVASRYMNAGQGGFVGGNSAITAPQTANKMRTERIVIVAEGNDSGEIFTEFPTPSH
jgi:hypothetical protein